MLRDRLQMKPELQELPLLAVLNSLRESRVVMNFRPFGPHCHLIHYHFIGLVFYRNGNQLVFSINISLNMCRHC